jgi:methionyl aminopeptidase
LIEYKSKNEIAMMEEAGKIVAETHELLADAIEPGITTKELDTLAAKFIASKKAIPSFKGYGGFPAVICASINNQVVHGIPGPVELKDGDIISVDIGAQYKGYHGDAARTHAVGTISKQAQRLIDVAKESFFCGVEYAVEGNRLQDISHAVQQCVEENGFSVVRDLVGHGIGRELHEDPSVPNFGSPHRGVRLRAGMALAIEPMINVGQYHVKTLSDGWTVVTRDGSLSAHYENTIVITEDGPLILT